MKRDKKGRFTSEGMKGNQINKGRDPWNKGKVGAMPTPWNKGRKCSDIERKQMSERMLKKYNEGYVAPAKGRKYPHAANLPQNFKFKDMKGENNPAYTGYQSKRHEITKVEWLILRNLILERDLFKCQHCGKTHHETILDIHHKIPYAISKSNHPDNLIALCKVCHKKAEWKYNKNAASTGEISKIIVSNYH